ncbi:Plexin domain-containing protein 2-like protein [Leptotrombidium deliense]|uniref:Plexin domain-containing protein 2-like protein n=1 Tax=Leptotrombidium deliense TaxID=299467 RepID=A0A443SCK7_9ACAR|nr:Plexin domain-containing protein 2-like protein [Leptotrombidium deliense]
MNESLSNSRRKAVPLTLNFTFPYYGHPLKVVYITSGGFIFVGDTLHRWLAASQYIAPLMANFDTSLSNSSHVQYFTNETHFVVQWLNVQLGEQNTKESFSFQATLLKSGKIVFVYKNIPFSVKMISNSTHPLRLGISDAYIIEDIFKRKTIMEYDRIYLDQNRVTNYTAAILTPQRFCNTFKDCGSCFKVITNFNCKWCESVKRCSDGFDRYRQQWFESKCQEQNYTCPKRDAYRAYNGFNFIKHLITSFIHIFQ